MVAQPQLGLRPVGRAWPGSADRCRAGAARKALTAASTIGASAYRAAAGGIDLEVSYE